MSDSTEQRLDEEALVGSLRLKLLLLFRAAGRIMPIYWMLYDAVAAGFAYLVTLVASSNVVPSPFPWAHLGVVIFATAVGGNILGLQERRILQSRIKMLLKIFVASVFVSLVLILFESVVLYDKIPRLTLSLFGASFFSFLAFPRLLGHYAVHLYKIRILVVSDEEAAQRIGKCVQEEEDSYVFVGYCNDEPSESEKYLGGGEDIADLCLNLGVDQVVITSRFQENPVVLYQCFEAAKMGCEIQDELAFYEDFLEQVRSETINKGVFFSARVGHASPVTMMIKRSTDIVFSLIWLGLLSWTFPFIWVLARVSTGGSAIYRQTRCGQFGELFTIYKFRTMPEGSEQDGAQWAESKDPRATRIGAFLRITRLDETPQLWNILKGDMSFVGPRPERPELVRKIEEQEPYFSLRHWARPGLTGLAQIRFRYAASLEDARTKLRYDLYYIKNWSLFLDAQILLRTISLLMKGAR